MNTQHLVDLDKIPPDERPHIKDIAVKHNALASDVSSSIGDTPNEIESTGRILMALRLLEKGVLNAAIKTSSVLLPVLIAALIMRLFGLDMNQLKELLGLLGGLSG